MFQWAGQSIRIGHVSFRALMSTLMVSGSFFLASCGIPGASPMGDSTFAFVAPPVSNIPLPPLVLSPANGFETNVDTLSLVGICTAGLTVELSGTATDSYYCGSGTFSFTLSSTLDGSFSYNLTQVNSSGIPSPVVAFSWTRDTQAPSAPALTTPANNPHLSSQSTLTLGGSCETGTTVSLSGGYSSSTVCSGNAFQFVIPKSQDGTFSFDVSQIDRAGNASGVSSLTWNRDSSAPSAPVVTNYSSPLVSNASNLTLSGTCESGATVSLAGDASGTATCVGSSFSITVSKFIDGFYNFSLSQSDSAGNLSGSSSFVWQRDSSAAAPPVLSSPSVNPFYSNSSSITLSGTCTTGATVHLTGGSTQSQVCASGTFSFSVNKSSDGSYSFSLHQVTVAGTSSSAVSLTWIRDTSAPAPLVLSGPASPLVNNASSVTLSGSCETGATVQLSGSGTGSTGCASSAFSFTVPKSTDGSFTFSLNQTDVAGNTSSSVSYVWQRDTVAPAAPGVTSPTSPHTGNAASLVLSGTCESGASVRLTGDAALTASCSAGVFSFTVPKSLDATYGFSISQTDAANNSSSAVSFSWTRDTVVPARPVIVNPAGATLVSNASQITIDGTCETGATVSLTGAATQSAVCSGGVFAFTVSRSTDGVYSFGVHQTDAAGNASSSASVSFTRDTVAPGAPSLSSPTSPLVSRDTNLNLIGTCESGATVTLSGDASASVTCSSGAYSIPLTKNSDGNFGFSLVQTDPAGNISAVTGFSWLRDTAAPAAPGITSPSVSPFVSSDTNLTISGTCETGALIQMSGASTGSVTCSGGGFTFTVTKSSDGNYSFGFVQTDAAGNASGSTSLSWTRSSAIPLTPVMSSPASNPLYSNSDTLVLAGTCTNGNTVEVTGGATLSQACSGGAFSFSVTKTLDGAHSFSIRQRSVSAIYSGAASVVWNRDTVAPAAPVITTPASSPRTANGSSFVVAGTCGAGNSVVISGDTPQASLTCSAGGSFSFTVTETADGTYDYFVNQVDLAGNVSANSTAQWIRDTVSPGMVTVDSPADNPYNSGDTNLTISVSCEPLAVVVVTGSASRSGDCSPLGSYSFSVSQSADGNYSYLIQQTDVAGNASPTLTFAWTRDTTIPFTPVVTASPAPSSNPYYSRGSSLTLRVTCDTARGGTVSLGGDVIETEVSSPANSLFQTCNSSPVTFVIQKSTDGVYHLSFNQEDPNTGATSADAAFTWVRDTTAPSPPSLINPSVSPYIAPGNLTITGICDPNARVNVTDSAAAQTLNTTCSVGGYFSVSVSKSVDGSYPFTLSQTDVAGNTSGSVSFTWGRNSSAIAPPGVSTPLVSPLTNNSSTYNLNGTCTTGYDVVLAGVSASDVVSPAGVLTQTCGANGSFSFQVAKSSDGTFAMTLVQKLLSLTSSAVGRTWVRDTVAPTVTFSSAPAPSSVNVSTTASFVFSANESASFQCKLDSGPYVSCNSPQNLTGLSNGSHTFSVRATDSAGNVRDVTRTWTQAAYNTLALYRFNGTTSAAKWADSGNYTTLAGLNHNLSGTASLSPAATPHQFWHDTSGLSLSSKKEALGFPTTTSTPHSLSASTTNSALDQGRQTLTIEGWFKFKVRPGRDQSITLVSKSGNGTAGNLHSWDFRIFNRSDKYHLEMAVSQNGTNVSVYRSSSSVSLGDPDKDSPWYYLAVTWNSGTVKFYRLRTTSSSVSTLNSSVVVGSSITQLSTTTAPLRIGANASTTASGTHRQFNGSMDELRISQTVRNISTSNYASSLKTTEFSPD